MSIYSNISNSSILLFIFSSFFFSKNSSNNSSYLFFIFGRLEQKKFKFFFFFHKMSNLVKAIKNLLNILCKKNRLKKFYSNGYLDLVRGFKNCTR